MPNVLSSALQIAATLLLTGIAGTVLYAVMDNATRFVL